MTGKQKEGVCIVEKENMTNAKTEPILTIQKGYADANVIQAKKCKGPGYEHYFLPAYKGVHINEILGYCKPCWLRQLVAENHFPSMLGVAKKGGGKNATWINNESL